MSEWDCEHGTSFENCGLCKRDRRIRQLELEYDELRTAANRKIADLERECSQWQEASGQAQVRAEEADDRAEKLERNYVIVLRGYHSLRDFLKGLGNNCAKVLHTHPPYLEKIDD